MISWLFFVKLLKAQLYLKGLTKMSDYKVKDINLAKFGSKEKAQFQYQRIEDVGKLNNIYFTIIKIISKR